MIKVIAYKGGICCTISSFFIIQRAQRKEPIRATESPKRMFYSSGLAFSEVWSKIEITEPSKAIPHPTISSLWTYCFLISRQPTITGPLKLTKITLWLMSVYFPAKIAQYYWKDMAKAAITRFIKLYFSKMLDILKPFSA